jgi:hypothetical protein
MTTDKILDKLSKLKAAQESEARIGNSAAAEAFASMINAMLLRHELSMEEIPQGGLAPEEPIIELKADLAAYGIRGARVRIGWQEMLAGVVAHAHLCKHLVARGTNKIWFVGTESNAACAEYAYGVLASAADRMSMAAREQWWKNECGGRHLSSGNYRAAWLHGFISRIAERFDEARRAEVQATGNASMALVKLDGALMRAKDYVSAKFKGKKGIAAAAVGTGNRDGYGAGRAAADTIAVGRKGITAASPAQRLIAER